MMSAWPGDAPGGKTPTLQFNSCNTRSVLVRNTVYVFFSGSGGWPHVSENDTSSQTWSSGAPGLADGPTMERPPLDGHKRGRRTGRRTAPRRVAAVPFCKPLIPGPPTHRHAESNFLSVDGEASAWSTDISRRSGSRAAESGTAGPRACSRLCDECPWVQ